MAFDWGGQQKHAHRTGQDGSHATLALPECCGSAGEAARHLPAIRGCLIRGRRHRQRRRSQPARAIICSSSHVWTSCFPSLRPHALGDARDDADTARKLTEHPRTVQRLMCAWLRR